MQGDKLINTYIYHMVSFTSRQDEPNTALWLAAQASKMERYCPLGIELELSQYDPAILKSRLVHDEYRYTVRTRK